MRTLIAIAFVAALAGCSYFDPAAAEMRRAHALSDEMKYAQAEAACDRVLARDPANADAAELRLRCRYLLGEETGPRVARPLYDE